MKRAKAIVLCALCSCISLAVGYHRGSVSVLPGTTSTRETHSGLRSETSRVRFTADRARDFSGYSGVYEFELSFAVVALPLGIPIAQVSETVAPGVYETVVPVRQASIHPHSDIVEESTIDDGPPIM